MTDSKWTTSITNVEPNKILLRGLRVEELMGRVSFGDAVYLLLKGELPKANEGKMIEAILVSVIDHGPTAPSAYTTRNIASTGAELNAAVAGGILAISHYHGGAIEEGMDVLHEAVTFKRENRLSTEEAAQLVIEAYREAKKRISGLGHRLHTNDPRTARLFELAAEWGMSGEYVEMARALEEAAEKSFGRKLPINADGAIAAVLCEMDFPTALADAFFMIARVPGLVAHFHEERTRYKPLRKIDLSEIEYDGPEEKSLELGSSEGD